MRAKFDRFFGSDAAACLFVYFLIFLLFFRARWAFTVVNDGDEFFYMQWLRVFLGLDDASSPAVAENFYSAGASMIWLPAGLIGVLWSKVTSLDVDRCVWVMVSFYSSLLWGVGLYLMVCIAQELSLIQVSENRFKRVGKTVVLILNVPLLYYVTQRTLMSHSVEWVLALLVIFLTLRKKILWAVLAASFLSITRYNDVPAILLPLAAASTSEDFLSYVRKKRGLNVLIGLFALAVISYILWVCLIGGYDGHTFWELMRDFTWGSLGKFLYAADWGAVWLLPSWLMILFIGAWRLNSLSRLSKAAWLWMFSGFFLCVIWRENGGDFGQRYLIGTYAAAVILGHELLIGTSEQTKNRVWVFLCANAFSLTLFTAIYKSLPDTGLVGNPTFLLKALGHVFDPQYYLNQFFHAPIGTLMHSSLQIPNTVFPADAEVLHLEGVYLLSVITVLAILYSVLYVVLSFQRKVRNANGLV